MPTHFEYVLFLRFYGKFQRIVQDEQEENFITKLHRGQLDILPWPVIQSPEFYDLMSLLKERLDSREASHGNASMFLQTLKTLMAKLKASDWGALDREPSTLIPVSEISKIYFVDRKSRFL